MRKRSEPTLRQALGLARQVIATDPNYAPGQALYAELVGLLSDDPDSYGRIPAATATRVGEAHARIAIRLAPNLADGYAALIGIDLEARPGKAPWRVGFVDRGGIVRKSAGMITVKARNFPVQRLTLPKSMVDLSPENERRAEGEPERTQKTKTECCRQD